jgi:hypothetical protein
MPDTSAPLPPLLTDLRKVAAEAEVAFAVGLAAQQEGLAPKTTAEELRQRVQQSSSRNRRNRGSAMKHPGRPHVVIIGGGFGA